MLLRELVVCYNWDDDCCCIAVKAHKGINMSRQNDFYRELHPDQFSDSSIIKRGKLNRDYFDFYLNSLSSRSQEKEFERFCIQMIEAEVCPNLTSQTGPTGGGDSKVDSETYPVSECITESWYYGFGNKSGTERWAFAFSIKKEWKPKVKSDVEKIVETNKLGRGYTKVFFVSSQYIPDKKRADTEDGLRAEYGIDIRIFDRTWLLDTVFSSSENQIRACRCFNLSEDLVDEKRIGERDYARKQQLEEAEKKLASIADMKASEIVSVANRCVILARELEVPPTRILGYIQRNAQLAIEYGTKIDQADAYYENAWTLYWWYSDAEQFYSNYLALERIAVEEKNAHLFANLVTLWINLNMLVLEKTLSGVEIEKHIEILKNLFAVLTSDKNKPNRILVAQAAFQLIRPFIGDDINDVVDTYIDIIRQSENSLEVDISQINKIITRIPLFQEAKRYDELFELLIARTSREKERGVASRLLARRGHALLETDPLKALSLFSRAIIGFYNEAYSHNLLTVVFEMAEAFQAIDLYWAARNYYLFALSYSLKCYTEKGETSPFLFIAAGRLKWLEAMQGRFFQSSEMYRFEKIGLSLYPKDVPDESVEFDTALAFLIFRSDFEAIKRIRRLPAYLDSLGLYMSATAFRYELGLYDENLLQYLKGDRTAFDEYMKNWCNQPAWDQIRDNTWYGIESICSLKSRVMGCDILVRTDKDSFNIEFAVSLLASIECFLGTGFAEEIFSMASSFAIDVIGSSDPSFSIDIDYKRENPTHMVIKVSRIPESSLLEAQKIFTDRVTEIISIVVSVLVNRESDFQKLKELVERDDIMLRTQLFANSLINGVMTFGENAYEYDDLTAGLDETDIQRTGKLSLHTPDRKTEDEQMNPSIIYGRPPENDFKKMGNSKIVSTGIINAPLWNVSAWRGIAYLFIPSLPPVLSFLFENESGSLIFDDWIEKYGNDDIEDSIGIRIIEGIDRSNPYWYRVAVGCNSLQTASRDTNGMILSLTRLHTLQPSDDQNLRMFKQRLQSTGSFYILPTMIGKGPDYGKKIFKHSGCIKIINAYEVSEDDPLVETAILPTDDPLIPEGIDDSAIKRVLSRKRKTQGENMQ